MAFYRPLQTLAAAALAVALAACAPIKTPVDTPSASSDPTVRPSRPADMRLPRVREALAAAEAGRFDAGMYADLVRHPLYGWIELASLRRSPATLTRERADAFLRRYDGQAVAAAFREVWITEAARRGEWAAVEAAWRPGIKDVSLQCYHLQAQHALGRTAPPWTQQVQTLWREAGKSLPGACDAVIAALDAAGGLTPALRWERIDRAAEAGQPAVMRAAARGLPVDEAALAADYAAFVETVGERAAQWPRTDRSRRIASYGLARYAAGAPADAERLLARIGPALGFGEAERGRVLYQSALQSASSYLPGSAEKLAAVPEISYDDRLYELRVREALARSDWRSALVAIRRMTPKLRSDSRWTYFEARLAELAGERETAARLYRAAAAKPEFHGFLAADRLDQPYTLCPWIPGDSPTARAAVENDPAIVRSMALYDLGRSGWAVAEWNDAIGRFDGAQKALAVKIAQEHGWFDRAVFSLGKTDPEELRLYTLRFPLHHVETIRREAARSRIDPSWVAAEIRAESIFNPVARSSANAIGLMQVLPTTGVGVASRLGIPWNGEATLLDPEANIAIGTAYLRELMDSFGEGKPYYTMAGYNAGPAPLKRWKTQRPGMDPDFWIETISYKETRDYVARVLAFSVLYDWRMGGDALRVSDRMHGRLDGRRTRFACPATTAPPAPQPQLAAERRG